MVASSHGASLLPSYLRVNVCFFRALISGIRWAVDICYKASSFIAPVTLSCKNGANFDPLSFNSEP
jgi:hypothetical protein